MSTERVRTRLTQLRQELDATDVDPQTRALMRVLDADIQKALGDNARIRSTRWPTALKQWR